MPTILHILNETSMIRNFGFHAFILAWDYVEKSNLTAKIQDYI
jgi:hypothetical protein